MGEVTLAPVDADSWRAVEAVDTAAPWMATTANHLLLCLCGGVWKPLAIHAGDEVVGLVRWGFDPDDGHHWIGGFTIDRAHQGKRIGSAALSWAPENLGAARLYRSFGFVGGGEPYGVTVARLAL